MFGRYLKNASWDFVLCVILVCCINVTIDSAFFVPRMQQYNYALMIGLAVLLNVLLFVGAYDKRSIVITIGAFIVAIAAFLIVTRGTSINIFAETEENPYTFYILLALVALIVFLLSRIRIGVIVLFASGILILGAVEFLYQSGHLFSFVVFICATGAMYVLKNYMKNVIQTSTVQNAFGRTFTVAVVTILIVFGISAGLFFGVVRQMDPQARELKLITRYMALPTVPKVGVGDTYIVHDKEMTTDQLNEEIRKLKKQEAEKQKEEELEKLEAQNNAGLSPNLLDILKDALFRLIDYMKDGYGWLVITLAIMMLCVGSIGLKLLSRRLWYQKRLTESYEVQVRKMYQYYLNKFHIMKIERQEGDTLYEFVTRAKSHLERFSVGLEERAGPSSFKALTETYVKISYGNDEVTEDEIKRYLIFHRAFYKNSRTYLGNFGYIRKFFVL
jgi:hypothetical protein